MQIKLENLQQDVTKAIAYYQDNMDRINNYRLIYDDIEKTLIKTRSSYRSKMLKKMYEKLFPNLERAILEDDEIISVRPLFNDTNNYHQEHQNILNYFWNFKMDKVNFVSKMVRRYAIDGTAILKVGWQYNSKITKDTIEEIIFSNEEDKVQPIIDATKDENIKQQLIDKLQNGEPIPIGKKEVIIEKERVINNYPIIDVIDPRFVIIDPTAKKSQDAMFVCEVKLITKSELLSSNINYINIDKIDEDATNNLPSDLVNSLDDYDDYNQDETLNFRFADNRNRYTMYEYWGYYDIDNSGILEPIVVSWIGNTIIRMEKNPYSHGKIPYIFAQYLPNLDGIMGFSNAELVKDDQGAVSALMRATQDIMMEHAVGQEFISQDLFADPVQQENYRKGRPVYTRRGVDPKTAIYKKTIQPIDNTIYNLLELYNKTADTSVRLSSPDFQSTPQAGFGGVQIQPEVETNRSFAVLKRLISALEEAFMLIISMNKEFLLEDTIYLNRDKEVKTLGKLGEQDDEFIPIINIETLQEKNRKAMFLMELMRTNAANMTPQVSGLHYAKLADLLNFHDLSKQVIEDVNREPTEQEKQIEQLKLEYIQLQNEQLKAKISKDYSDSNYKTGKIQIEQTKVQPEIMVDMSKAKLNTETADKLHAQTQLFNQEFNLIDSGIKREWAKQDNEYDHYKNLQREQIRTDREQQNIFLKENAMSKLENKATIHNDFGKDKNQISYLYNHILKRNSLDIEKQKEISDIDDIIKKYSNKENKQ